MSAEVTSNIENNLNDASQMDVQEEGSQQASKTLLSASRQRQLNEEQENATANDFTKGVTDMSQAVTVAEGSKTMGETKTKKKSKPAYLQSLNESEKQANFKIIEKMNKKISFLKNPRFKKNKAPIIMTDAMKN